MEEGSFDPHVEQGAYPRVSRVIQGLCQWAEGIRSARIGKSQGHQVVEPAFRIRPLSSGQAITLRRYRRRSNKMPIALGGSDGPDLSWSSIGFTRDVRTKYGIGATAVDLGA